MVNAVEPVELDLLDARIRKTRARNVVITAVVLALAAGGVVGLFAGPLGFAIAAVVVASPLLLLAVGEKRKTTRLSGTEISVRTLGSKRVELKEATQLDVFVTDMRGVRTVNLLVAGPPSGKAIAVALAMYAGTGGRELGVLELRRLADALASTGSTQALVLSELLVAQLRAEARGDAAADRPLHQLAASAPEGRMAQKLRPDAVASFVAALEN